jgi:hypothetical protein
MHDPGQGCAARAHVTRSPQPSIPGTKGSNNEHCNSVRGANPRENLRTRDRARTHPGAGVCSRRDQRGNDHLLLDAGTRTCGQLDHSVSSAGSPGNGSSRVTRSDPSLLPQKNQVEGGKGGFSLLGQSPGCSAARSSWRFGSLQSHPLSAFLIPRFHSLVLPRG